MLQTSFVGYLVSGVFLSKAYFDVAYHLFLVLAILKHMADEGLPALRPEATNQPTSFPPRRRAVGDNESRPSLRWPLPA